MKKEKVVLYAKLILLGTLQITAYRAVPWQTKPECKNRDHCYTATGDTPSKQGLAVSQDLLLSGRVKYGDVLYIEGYGYRIVNDCLNARIHNAVDLFMYTKEEEKQVGVRHLKVWRISNE